MAVSSMPAHRGGNQAYPYAIVAEHDRERELEPSLARLLAVQADLAAPDSRPSDSALTGMLMLEQQSYLDVAAAPVRSFKDLNCKFGVTQALLGQEDLDRKLLTILLAALSADMLHLMRIN